MGGLRGFKIQLLTGSDGEEGLSSQPPIYRGSQTSKVKSIRGTWHLLRVNPKGQRGDEPENERQAKIARPNGKGLNLGQSRRNRYLRHGGGYACPRLEGGL